MGSIATKRLRLLREARRCLLASLSLADYGFPDCDNSIHRKWPVICQDCVDRARETASDIDARIEALMTP